MTHRKQTRLRFTLLFLIVVGPLGAGLATGRDNVLLTLPKSARVGVVNLLDPSVTHFHASRVLAQSFLKMHRVNWQIDAMLADAVRQRLTQLNLVGVSLAPGDTLARNSDDYFVNNSVAKKLPRECANAFAQLASAEHLDALIVLAAGLNNSAQAGSAVQRSLPDYLRGWGFVTKADSASKPALFNMTQVLLIGVSAGEATLIAREWGGSYTDDWAGYVPPTDLKQMPPELLDQLEPLFARILTRQTGRLMDWLAASP